MPVNLGSSLSTGAILNQDDLDGYALYKELKLDELAATARRGEHM